MGRCPEKANRTEHQKAEAFFHRVQRVAHLARVLLPVHLVLARQVVAHPVTALAYLAVPSLAVDHPVPAHLRLVRSELAHSGAVHWATYQPDQGPPVLVRRS